MRPAVHREFYAGSVETQLLKPHSNTEPTEQSKLKFFSLQDSTQQRLSNSSERGKRLTRSENHIIVIDLINKNRIKHIYDVKSG